MIWCACNCWNVRIEVGYMFILKVGEGLKDKFRGKEVT